MVVPVERLSSSTVQHGESCTRVGRHVSEAVRVIAEVTCVITEVTPDDRLHDNGHSPRLSLHDNGHNPRKWCDGEMLSSGESEARQLYASDR